MLLPVAEWQTCLKMKRTIKHNLIWSQWGDDSIRTETLFTFWSQWQERCHYYVRKGFIRTCTRVFLSCSLLIYVTAIYTMLLKLLVFLFYPGCGAVYAAHRHCEQHGELPLSAVHVDQCQLPEQFCQQPGRRFRRQWRDGHDAGRRAHSYLQQLCPTQASGQSKRWHNCMSALFSQKPGASATSFFFSYSHIGESQRLREACEL